MSQELFAVVAPSPDGVDAAERAVRHAASRVPGHAGLELARGARAAVGLVSTGRPGATAGRMTSHEGAVSATLATSVAGLHAAQRSDSRELGSEAGHVRLSCESDGSTVLSTDGIAFLPGYWAVHRDRLLFSTSLPALVSLGLPADVDERAFWEYLALHHPMQQRTLLTGASALGPGGRVTWSPGRAPTAEVAPLFVPSDDALSDADAVAAFREAWPAVLTETLERRRGVRLVQGLSGGFDSRAIATGFAGVGAPLHAYTYGDRRSREVRVAQRVGERLGLPHTLVPVSDDRLLRGAREAAGNLDGAHNAAEMYEHWFTDQLRDMADVVVNGHGGNPLWGDDKAVGLRDVEQVRRQLVTRYGGYVAQSSTFLRAAAGDVEAGIRTALDESLARWDFSARPDTSVFWNLGNRQVRWGNMLVNALRREGLALEAPFLTSTMLRLLRRLAPDQRMNGRLYMEVHRTVLTATADLARSDDGNSPNTLSHAFWSNDVSFQAQLAQLARRHPVSAARRVGRRGVSTGIAALGRRGVAPSLTMHQARLTAVFPSDAWLRTSPTYQERMADLLDAAAAAAGQGPLDAERVAEAAARVRAGTPPASASVLGRVSSAGLWLQDLSDRAAARDVSAAQAAAR